MSSDQRLTKKIFNIVHGDPWANALKSLFYSLWVNWWFLWLDDFKKFATLESEGGIFQDRAVK